MNARIYVMPLLMLSSTLHAAEKPKPPLAMAPFHDSWCCSRSPEKGNKDKKM